MSNLDMCPTCGHRNNEKHANWCDYTTTTRTSEYACDSCGREVDNGNGLYTPQGTGDRFCEDCYIKDIILVVGE
jgi:DNA-directed RNA polymerase subunit RPC12/RpoP